jgi:AraC-like DNA-binding protein
MILFERRTRNVTLQIRRYECGRHMPKHAHDSDGLSLVLDGALVEEVRHRTVESGPGWTVVKPRHTYHSNTFSPTGATLLGITFESKLHESTLGEWRWLDSAAAFRLGLRLLRAVRVGDADREEEALIELLGLCSAVDSRRSAWVYDVRRIIDSDGAQSPSVTEIAQRVGVHPVYLARRFRDAFGVSLREYRQMVQVLRATEMVLRTRKPLSEIAHSCGFADHSHMCRSFRVVAGISPATLRAS